MGPRTGDDDQLALPLGVGCGGPGCGGLGGFGCDGCVFVGDGCGAAEVVVRWVLDGAAEVDDRCVDVGCVGCALCLVVVCDARAEVWAFVAARDDALVRAEVLLLAARVSATPATSALLLEARRAFVVARLEELSGGPTNTAPARPVTAELLGPSLQNRASLTVGM